MSTEVSTSVGPTTTAPGAAGIAPGAEQKLATAQQHKEAGDQAFKSGDVKGALLQYHRALLYLTGLDKNALSAITGNSGATAASDSKEEKKKTVVDETLEKIYANMAACHLKTGNWQRVIESADKSLKIDENNTKALYRKGKALGEQGFFEKAVKVLEDVKKKNPAETAIVDQEIARLRAIDNEREKAHKQKLKGFLNKSKAKEDAAASGSS